MDREILDILALDYIEGKLEGDQQRKFDEAVRNGELDLDELNKIKESSLSYEQLPLPEPSERLKSAFFDSLEKAQATYDARLGFWQRVTNPFLKLGWTEGQVRMAFGTVLLLAGIGIGLIISPSGRYSGQLETLTTEVQDMREMMMLTLLDKESVSERLRAVSISEELGEVNETVVTALFQTLDNDDNVNVRLATLDVLEKYANYPTVRERLVQSINGQDSPLVLMALAETMVRLQEKSSVEEFRGVLDNENTPEEVKQKIKESIAILI